MLCMHCMHSMHAAHFVNICTLCAGAPSPETVPRASETEGHNRTADGDHAAGHDCGALNDLSVDKHDRALVPGVGAQAHLAKLVAQWKAEFVSNDSVPVGGVDGLGQTDKEAGLVLIRELGQGAYGKCW